MITATTAPKSKSETGARVQIHAHLFSLSERSWDRIASRTLHFSEIKHALLLQVYELDITIMKGEGQWDNFASVN